MDSDSHIQIQKIHLSSHLPDYSNHVYRHFNHVSGFSSGVSVKGVQNPHHNITVPYGIDLVDFMFPAFLVEFFEERFQQCDHLAWGGDLRGKLREIDDVSKKHRHLGETVAQL